jgi:hypothetical protein
MEVGVVEFVTTDSLLQNTFTGPSIGTPNIRSLYLRDSIISTAIFIAMNCEPKVDDSTVFCASEHHIIGAEFR